MGIYYNPPQPAQLASHLVQASSGQNPPIKALAATAAAILTLWPVGYDHSAYAQNYRPKQTAPLTLVYGAQPPVTSLASFYARRSQWTDATWVQPPSTPNTAPLSLAYGQAPPVTSTAALYAQRAQWSDATWPSPQSPPEAAIAPRIDNPPLRADSPVFIKDPARPIYGVAWQYGTQNAKSDFSGWSAPPPAQPPPIIGAGAPDALSSWTNPTWSSQDLNGPVVQSYAGDEPPGISSSCSDLAAFGYFDGWPAQRLAFAATVVPPPIVSGYLPPNDFPYSALLAWQSAPTWTAQTQPDVQPLAPIVYGSQPPSTSIARSVAIRASWADATWPTQSADNAAAIAPAPAVNAPPGKTLAVQFAVRANWPDATWAAQSAGDFTASGPVAAVPAGPPDISAILTWAPANWSSQSAPANAGWNVPQQAASVPFVSPPYQALASWAPTTWLSQLGARVPLATRGDSPQPTNSASLYALRLSWTEPGWPSQVAWARGSADTLPSPVIYPRVEVIRLSPDDRRIVMAGFDARILLKG